ncbi:MAG: hypothetical protein AB9891_03810 [Anaerolineaceae bacterium]
MKDTFDWKSLILLALVFYLLSGCQKTRNITQESRNDACIPPAVSYLIPQKPMDLDSVGEKKEIIYPSGDWQQVQELPGEFIYAGYPKLVINLQKNEIWLVGFDPQKHSKALLRFKIDTNEWQVFDSSNSRLQIFPDQIFIDQKGVLWGVNRPENGKLSAIKFDDEINNFSTFDITGLSKEVKSLDHPLKAEFFLGKLWMILKTGKQNSLFVVDLDERKITQKRIEFDLASKNFSFDSHGNIWLLGQSGGFTVNTLVRYSPTNNEVEIFPTKLVYGQPTFVYVDREDHVWAGVNEWLDFTNPDAPIHNEIIRSSVFVLEGSHPEFDYMWLPPSNMVQSSDGLYWFEGNGVIRLDPKNGQWCKVSNYGSQVLEDKSHNLWAVINKKLFILPRKNE